MCIVPGQSLPLQHNLIDPSISNGSFGGANGYGPAGANGGKSPGFQRADTVPLYPTFRPLTLVFQ
jgi:hypothetical protein